MSDSSPYRKVVLPDGYATVSPLPSSEELSRFYADLYFQQQASATYQSEYSMEELAHKRLRSALTVYALKRLLQEPAAKGRFIDIGCGEGFMLAEAHGEGFDVLGLDYSTYGVQKFHPDLIERVRQGDAIELTEKLAASGDRAAICVLQNVLEHVGHPKELMACVRKVLESRGLVAVTVPNDYSRIQQRATELGWTDREYWFAPPQHLYYFNTDNMAAFAKSVSFEIVDAFGDFPIEVFLFHRGSNYVLDRKQGKQAHNARVVLDLLLAERGLAPYHQLGRALAACGMGRNITFILKPMAAHP